jgi:trimeric autotransporter adhesin
MRWNFVKVLLLMGILIYSIDVSIAQNIYERMDLKKLAEVERQSFQNSIDEAYRLAEILKLPIKAEGPDGTIVELIAFDNGYPVYVTTHNAQGAEIIKSSDVYIGGGAGLALSGAGVTLGIWDQNRVRVEHQELVGRVTQMDSGWPNSNHATHVAGTLIASGEDSLSRGMSYEAMLHAYDWNFDTAEMAEEAENGLQASQHSYGYVTGWHRGNWANGSNNHWHWFGNTNISETEDATFGFYLHTTESWDNLAYNAPYYLIVKSAGNDRGQGPNPADSTFHYAWINGGWVGSNQPRDRDGGTDGYDCLSHRAVAKNVLSVGAVNANLNMTNFSSSGPTDDGRIKPDIVAKGAGVRSSTAANNASYASYNGTSMSGPMISGSLGLLIEHQENLHPGQKILASSLKALVIHGADDMVSGAPGPNYRFGWGLMDTRKSAEIMSRRSQSDGAYIFETTIENGEELVFEWVATGEEPLKATVVWTDIPGTPPPLSLNPTDLMLVNDLDMRIADENENTFFPYILDPSSPNAVATTGDNFRDNVEMIYIESPTEEGLYTLTITHKGTLPGPQMFSLIVTGANIPGCPLMAIAPQQLELINSVCDMDCVIGGGYFIEPDSDVCPEGSFLEYKVDDSEWTTTIPVYNQQGPEQNVYTRCVCNEFNSVRSPQSLAKSTLPGDCNRVTNSDNNGIGTLRNAIHCAEHGDIIYFDQPTVNTSNLTSHLTIDKSITIQGLDGFSTPTLTIDFTNIQNQAGLIITGDQNTITLQNLNIHATYNIDLNPVILVEPNNSLISKESVLVDE